MFIKLTLETGTNVIFNVNNITEIMPSPHPDDKHKSVIVLNDQYGARQVKESFEEITAIIKRVGE